MIALILEVINDRDGDLNKGADVFVRLFFFAFEAWAVHFIFDKPAWAAFLLSTAIFFLFFDYVIAYVLIRNGTLEPPRGVKYHWFSYVAKEGVIDNLKFWKSLKPGIKLGIRIAYFVLSLVLFLIAIP